VQRSRTGLSIRGVGESHWYVGVRLSINTSRGAGRTPRCMIASWRQKTDSITAGSKIIGAAQCELRAGAQILSPGVFFSGPSNLDYDVLKTFRLAQFVHPPLLPVGVADQLKGRDGSGRTRRREPIQRVRGRPPFGVLCPRRVPQAEPAAEPALCIGSSHPRGRAADN
jgi:hypothetical protein